MNGQPTKGGFSADLNYKKFLQFRPFKRILLHNVRISQESRHRLTIGEGMNHYCTKTYRF